jgi:hypothetical protein
MYRACIVTAYVGTGSGSDPYRPRLADAYPSIRSWQDVTGQSPTVIYPDPDAYSIEILCDEATLTALDADARFVVLWSEEESVVSLN